MTRAYLVENDADSQLVLEEDQLPWHGILCLCFDPFLRAKPGLKVDPTNVAQRKQVA